MNLVLLTLALFNSLNRVSSINVCGNSPQDNFYISNNLELNNINNCNIINGSIYINGGYDITTLNSLVNLKEITGNLVIIYSHILNNLKGLQNLEKIHGKDFYLDQYSLAIKHNNNNLDDLNHGLCFVDTIDWDSIIETGEKLNHGNSLNCSLCDPQCNGCYGPGPFLCQTCNNFKSGDSCVETCFNTTNIGSDNTCNEVVSESPILTVTPLSYNEINISWSEPSNPGGVIFKYELYQNNQLIYTTSYNDSSYEINQLIRSYISNNLQEGTEYSYYVLSYNTQGSNSITTYYATTFVRPTPQPTSQPTPQPTSKPTPQPTSPFAWLSR